MKNFFEEKINILELEKSNLLQSQIHKKPETTKSEIDQIENLTVTINQIKAENDVLKENLNQIENLKAKLQDESNIKAKQAEETILELQKKLKEKPGDSNDQRIQSLQQQLTQFKILVAVCVIIIAFLFLR